MGRRNKGWIREGEKEEKREKWDGGGGVEQIERIRETKKKKGIEY